MKRICGLILVFTMFFSVTSFSFATEDVCPMIVKPNPIKYMQK
tara:strand:+ start:672 stop:800 length:129 start_codon:yes stop_codon:yes gene_type:complete